MSETVERTSNRISSSINSLTVYGNVYFVQSDKEAIIIDRPINSPITNILTKLERTDLSSEQKSRAEEMIKEVEAELEGKSPDRNKVKKILTQAGLISKDIGILLLEYALNKGMPWPTMS